MLVLYGGGGRRVCRASSMHLAVAVQRATQHYVHMHVWGVWGGVDVMIISACLAASPPDLRHRRLPCSGSSTTSVGGGAQRPWRRRRLCRPLLFRNPTPAPHILPTHAPPPYVSPLMAVGLRPAPEKSARGTACAQLHQQPLRRPLPARPSVLARRPASRPPAHHVVLVESARARH